MPWNADLWRGQFLQEGYRYEEAEYSQYMNHRTIRIFSCTNLSPAASFKLKARIHLTRPRQTPDLGGVSILLVFSVCCRTNEVSHGHFHPLGGETQIRSSRPLSGRFGSFRVVSFWVASGPGMKMMKGGSSSMFRWPLSRFDCPVDGFNWIFTTLQRFVQKSSRWRIAKAFRVHLRRD